MSFKTDLKSGSVPPDSSRSGWRSSVSKPLHVIFSGQSLCTQHTEPGAYGATTSCVHAPSPSPNQRSGPLTSSWPTRLFSDVLPTNDDCGTQQTLDGGGGVNPNTFQHANRQGLYINRLLTRHSTTSQKPLQRRCGATACTRLHTAMLTAPAGNTVQSDGPVPCKTGPGRIRTGQSEDQMQNHNDPEEVEPDWFF